MTPEEEEKKKRDKKLKKIGYEPFFEAAKELPKPDGHCFKLHWERKRNKEIERTDDPSQPWYG